MIVLQNYWLAILFCVFAMICWGSWSNTQKMVQNNWRFELFYWDLIIGILLMSLVAAFTVGSMGETGRSFVEDIKQADISSIVFAMLGGLLWNLGNLLLVAAIAIAGMSVAFPIGGGLAWILGIILNYINVVMKGGVPSTKPALLWTGVIIIIAAIFLSGKSYSNLTREKKSPSNERNPAFSDSRFVYRFFLSGGGQLTRSIFCFGWKRYAYTLLRRFLFCSWGFYKYFFHQPCFYAKPG
jgi:glucose uptake protein